MNGLAFTTGLIKAVIIHYQTLSNEALKGIAEQFVLSQLSDVESQPNLKEWVDQAVVKVKSGELIIEFSQVDGSVTLKRAEEVALMVND